jgi:uncharacterized protein YndB with AHSA1/START domain
MTNGERTIERKVPIAAERSRVFRALMDPGALSRWLFASVDMTPEQGRTFSFEWRDTAAPATAQGEILELVRDERLVLSWFMEADGVTSTASFDLSDGSDGGTLLTFRQSGLPPGTEWDPRFRRVSLEWDKVLQNLRFLMEEKGEGKHLFYFRMETPLQFPAARAFHAWTTSSGLSAWMADEVFVIPEEEQEIEGLTLDTRRPLSARFLRIEPNRHLRMSWSEGGLRGLLGVSFWPAEQGIVLSLTLRSFALMEGERPIIQALWEKRFQRLAAWLERKPLQKAPPGSGAITLQRDFEVTPSRLWNALTDASLMRRWLVSWTDFEPRVGAPYTFLWEDYGEDQGVVLEVRPGELIRYTWDLYELGETTEVAFRIAPEPLRPGTCHVEFRHSGWRRGAEWDRLRAAHESGWWGVLAMLDFYFRHGAGHERRRFHLRRRLPLPVERAVELFSSPAGLQSWLGGEAMADPQPGGAFALTLSSGTEYRGHVIARHPSGDTALELESPVPALLEWGFAPDPKGSRVGLTFSTYEQDSEWVEERRREWADAVARIS